MPIIDLQRGVTESGRIRIGQLVASQNGSRPAKLDTFRLTSADRRRIDQIAALYGGTVSEWAAPAGKQWQVVTTTAELDVVVPPHELAFSQWYELWSAGGCQRRCDGANDSISEGPCRCDPEARQCDIHTRLSVMLRDLPGLGVWRIDTQGWYAARELRGAVEILAIAAGHGALLPARLRLDQRSVKRPDPKHPGKSLTLRFAVPVLDIEVSPAQLLAGGGAQPISLEAAALPAFTPVPALPMHDGPSIAEQSAPPPERAPRANGATEIPASGRTRRTTEAEGTSVERGTSQTTRLSRAPSTEQPAQDVDEAIDPTPAAVALEEDAEHDARAELGDAITRMVDLVKAAGKDPEQLRQQLGLNSWEMAPAETITKLTAKAQEALLVKAETVAVEPAATNGSTVKKPAPSRAKKPAAAAAKET